jgi:two-component system cell cycle sensor histidine kinase PleC
MTNNPMLRPGEGLALRTDLPIRTDGAAVADSGAASTSLALEISPDPLITLTPDGAICGVNQRSVDLFGYHASLMTGAHIGAFVSLDGEVGGNGAAGSADTLLDRLAASNGAPIEAVAHPLSGESRAVEITAICLGQGDQARIVCALRDVSHRKHNEDALVAAKEVAERANIAKLEFLSQLSHELRTPLAAIIGFGEVMRDEMFGPLGVKLYKTYAADICQSGRQLANVVERIIDVARLEGRMATAHARTADLGEMVERVVERLASEASKQNVRLCNNIRRGSLPVIIDDETLEKMISHVVENAIAFNRFGGRVDISAGVEPARDGNTVQLTVTDTGPGMTPDALDALRRTLEGTTNQAGGGLEICAAFLHLIGGRLDICSAQNLGTTVTMTFPRRHDGRWRP